MSSHLTQHIQALCTTLGVSNVQQLRDIAQQLQIPHYDTLSKYDLCRLLSQHLQMGLDPNTIRGVSLVEYEQAPWPGNIVVTSPASSTQVPTTTTAILPSSAQTLTTTTLPVVTMQDVAREQVIQLNRRIRQLLEQMEEMREQQEAITAGLPHPEVQEADLLQAIQETQRELQSLRDQLRQVLRQFPAVTLLFGRGGTINTGAPPRRITPAEQPTTTTTTTTIPIPAITATLTTPHRRTIMDQILEQNLDLVDPIQRRLMIQPVQLRLVPLSQQQQVPSSSLTAAARIAATVEEQALQQPPSPTTTPIATTSQPSDAIDAITYDLEPLRQFVHRTPPSHLRDPLTNRPILSLHVYPDLQRWNRVHYIMRQLGLPHEEPNLEGYDLIPAPEDVAHLEQLMRNITVGIDEGLYDLWFIEAIEQHNLSLENFLHYMGLTQDQVEGLEDAQVGVDFYNAISNAVFRIVADLVSSGVYDDQLYPLIESYGTQLLTIPNFYRVDQIATNPLRPEFAQVFHSIGDSLRVEDFVPTNALREILIAHIDQILLPVYQQAQQLRQGLVQAIDQGQNDNIFRNMILNRQIRLGPFLNRTHSRTLYTTLLAAVLRGSEELLIESEEEQQQIEAEDITDDMLERVPPTLDTDAPRYISESVHLAYVAYHRRLLLVLRQLLEQGALDSILGPFLRDSIRTNRFLFYNERARQFLHQVLQWPELSMDSAVSAVAAYVRSHATRLRADRPQTSIATGEITTVPSVAAPITDAMDVSTIITPMIHTAVTIPSTTSSSVPQITRLGTTAPAVSPSRQQQQTTTPSIPSLPSTQQRVVQQITSINPLVLQQVMDQVARERGFELANSPEITSVQRGAMEAEARRRILASRTII